MRSDYLCLLGVLAVMLLQSLQALPNRRLGTLKFLDLGVGVGNQPGSDFGKSGGVKINRADGDPRRGPDSVTF